MEFGISFFPLPLRTRKREIPSLLSLSQAFANVPAALQLLQTAFPQHPLPSVVPVWTCSVVPCDIIAWYFYCFHCFRCCRGIKNQTIERMSECDDCRKDFCSGKHCVLVVYSSPGDSQWCNTGRSLQFCIWKLVWASLFFFKWTLLWVSS